uniref:SAM domain-containing protein n=3 Tax=Macrostomum lignano TaxID=282301 RepID=A0A1I8J0M3_9PLAT
QFFQLWVAIIGRMESEIADLQNPEVPQCLYWSAEQVADWVSSLGLGQYRDCFLTNGINGRRLVLVDASNLPKIGVHEFQHVQALSGAVRDLLKIESPRWDRRIYLPPRDNLGMYLEMKSKTGKSLDELTYDKFNAKFSDAKWRPPVANMCLLLPPSSDENRSTLTSVLAFPVLHLRNVMLSVSQDFQKPPPPPSRTLLSSQEDQRAGGDSPNSSLTPSSSSSSLSSDSGSSSVVSSNSPIVGNQASVNVENDASSGSSSDVDDDVDGAAGASTTATTMIDPSADSVGISPGTDDSAILSDEGDTGLDADLDVDFFGLGDDVTACLSLLTSTAEVPEAEAGFLADFLTRPPLPTICGLGAVIQRLRRHGPPASPFQEIPGAAEDLQDPMPPVIEDVCRIGSPDSEALLQLLLSPHLAALWDCLLRVAHPPADETSIDLDDFLEIDISTAVGDAPDAANDPATVPLRRPQPPPQRPPPPAAFRRSVIGGGGGAHAASAAERTAPELFSRDVTLLKAADQPLGFTAVRCICPTSPKPAVAVAAASGDDGTASSSSLSASPRQAIAVARVLAGSQADVAGGLHVGDIIREANGQPMETPEALQRLLRQTVGRITLRIESETPPESPLSPPPPPMPEPRLLRACFDYQPERDPLLPSPELGLRFRHGDVLEVVDQSDEAFWQARPAGRPREPARLIPSQTLEERRKAFFPASRIVPGPADRLKQLYTKLHHQKPVMYRAQSAADFDRAELALYEDVARLAASPVSLLVLTGPGCAVGRDLLRRWLCRQYPLKFAAPRLISSDPERCGDAGGDLEFMPRQEMLAAIAAGDFVEFRRLGNDVAGDGGDLIGLSLESVRGSVSTGASSGLTVVLDCHPSAVRRLRLAELRPLVLFLATPDVAAQRELLAEAQSLGLVPESEEPGSEQQLQDA